MKVPLLTRFENSKKIFRINPEAYIASMLKKRTETASLSKAAYNLYVQGRKAPDFKKWFDGLSQAEFFRSYVDAYINNDALILEFVEKLKDSKGKRSKVKMKKTKKLHDIAKRIQKDFGMSDEELESIFELPMEELAEL